MIMQSSPSILTKTIIQYITYPRSGLYTFRLETFHPRTCYSKSRSLMQTNQPRGTTEQTLTSVKHSTNLILHAITHLTNARNYNPKDTKTTWFILSMVTATSISLSGLNGLFSWYSHKGVSIPYALKVERPGAPCSRNVIWCISKD